MRRLSASSSYCSSSSGLVGTATAKGAQSSGSSKQPLDCTTLVLVLVSMRFVFKSGFDSRRPLDPAPDRRALTIVDKTKRRVLKRPPLALIPAPHAPAKGINWMLARETRQVVPTVWRFPPG